LLAAAAHRGARGEIAVTKLQDLDAAQHLQEHDEHETDRQTKKNERIMN
jgi:hypothetical protein